MQFKMVTFICKYTLFFFAHIDMPSLGRTGCAHIVDIVSHCFFVAVFSRRSSLFLFICSSSSSTSSSLFLFLSLFPCVPIMSEVARSTVQYLHQHHLKQIFENLINKVAEVKPQEPIGYLVTEDMHHTTQQHTTHTAHGTRDKQVERRGEDLAREGDINTVRCGAMRCDAI